MSTKGFASQARTRSGRRAAARVRLCGSKRDACPVCGAQVPRITLRAPGTNPDPDAGPPATDSQRGLSAPPSGGCRPRAGPGTKLSGGTQSARSEFPEKRTGKDLRAEVPTAAEDPTAAEEAMAVVVRGLRLWRAAPSGGAAWSELPAAVGTRREA